LANPTELNNSILNRDSIVINATASDLNFANLTINLYDSSKNLVKSQTTPNKNLFANFSGLTNGLYYFNAVVYDLAGNSQITETRQVNVKKIIPVLIYREILPDGRIVVKNIFGPDPKDQEKDGAYLVITPFDFNLTQVNDQNAKVYLANTTTKLEVKGKSEGLSQEQIANMVKVVVNVNSVDASMVYKLKGNYIDYSKIQNVSYMSAGPTDKFSIAKVKVCFNNQAWNGTDFNGVC
jgi:hypothetical protein